MDLARAIATAAAPEPAVVLGVPLRPVSISHWLWLIRFDVSFIRQRPAHTLGDLLLAVLICSSRHAEFESRLTSGALWRDVQRLRRRLTGGRLASCIRALRRFRGQRVSPDDVLGFNLAVECAEMERHILAAFEPSDWSMPTTIPVEDPDRKAAAPPPRRGPAPMLYHTALTAECGLSLEEAWDIPITLGRWLVALNAERLGRVTLIDRDEAAEDKAAADKFARELAAQDGPGSTRAPRVEPGAPPGGQESEP